MLKYILFAIIGWFIFKFFRGARFLKRKNTITTQGKDEKSRLKIDKNDIEDADFKDLD